MTELEKKGSILEVDYDITRCENDMKDIVYEQRQLDIKKQEAEEWYAKLLKRKEEIK